MLATLATKPFRGDDWLFEIKWDGYRMQAVVGGATTDGKATGDGASKRRRIRTWTRNGIDAETYFPRLLNPPTWIAARDRDRGWRGRCARCRRPPGFQSPAGADQRAIDRRPRVPGIRPAPSRWAQPPARPARGSQAIAPLRPARASPCALRDPRRGRGHRVPRGRGSAAARGRDRQAPPLALRTRASGRPPG